MEPEFLKTFILVENRKLKDFAKEMDELWRYQGRVCVLESDDL